MTDNIVNIGIYGIPDIASGNYPVYVHDHSMVLFSEGEMLDYLHLERLTRQKHDHSLPQKLYGLLRSKGIFKNKTEVAFVDNTLGKAFISTQGNIRFEADQTANLPPRLETGRLYWLNEHKPGYNLNHELAHILSVIPFCGSFRENSLLFHFDGGASKSNYSLWLYRHGQLSLIRHGWELKKLAALYNANALVFALMGASVKDQNSVPGKFMGYAAYGKPDAYLEQWLLGHDFFSAIWKSKTPFFEAARKELSIDFDTLDCHHDFFKNLAATIQHYFVKALVAFIERQQNDIKADYLYYSGGSALNIVANTALIKTGLFKEIFIPPCPNDAGLSLGAAVALEWQQGHTIKRVSPYCNNWNIEDYHPVYDQQELDQMARLLLQHKVIGICNGYAEAGPRALGNRSIIALANSAKLAEKVSVQHKGREWFRPVAPVMLLRNLEYFSPDKPYHNLSRYMLMNYTIKPRVKAEINGAIHVDGTSRIQTIENKNENPFMFDLLTHLEANYGVKVLLNTSFNRKGEPMAHTTDDAMLAGQAMQLDALVLNGKLVSCQ